VLIEDSSDASLLGIKVSVVFMIKARSGKVDRIACDTKNAKNQALVTLDFVLNNDYLAFANACRYCSSLA